MKIEGRITLGNTGGEYRLIKTKNGKFIYSGSGWEGYKKDKTKDEWSYRWFDFKMFGDNAQRAQEELGKGTKIDVSGILDVEEWDDKTTGAKRSKVVICVFKYEVVNKQPFTDRSGNDRNMFDVESVGTDPKMTTSDIPW